MKSVEKSWMDLWKRLSLKTDPAIVYNELNNLYSQPHRYYHNLEHISHMLYEFHKIRDLAQNPDAIEMAIWFHDAIYDRNNLDSVLDSANLAVKTLTDQGLSKKMGSSVYALIMATDHSKNRSIDDQDCNLITDIDLSIFGRPRVEFDMYEKQIRQEYADIPKDTFSRKRRELLEVFLKRPRIYRTQYFYDKYEKTARQNLKYSINKLKA